MTNTIVEQEQLLSNDNLFLKCSQFSPTMHQIAFGGWALPPAIFTGEPTALPQIP